MASRPDQDITKDPSAPSRRVTAEYGLSERGAVLTLRTLNWKLAQISYYTGIPVSTCTSIIQKAKARGWDPVTNNKVLDVYVEDGKRTGRPRNVTKDAEEALSDTQESGKAPTV